MSWTHHILQNCMLPNGTGQLPERLKEKIEEVKPKYVIFGHFHGCYGVEEINDTTFINCTVVNEQYYMGKQPIYLEIEK